MLTMFFKDLRYGLRRIRRAPLTTGAILLTLSISIGIESLLFTMMNAVLFRPLPFTEPERLVMIWENNPHRGIERSSVSEGNFRDWRSQAGSFSTLVAMRPLAAAVEVGERVERVRGAKVSAGFFPLLGIRPVLGSFLDERPAGQTDAVVIGHALAQRFFGADREALGKVLRVEGRPYVVGGIAPPELHFPQGTDVWIPMDEARAAEPRGVRSLLVVARLRPSVSLHQAALELSEIATGLANLYPDTNLGSGVEIVPLRDELVRKSKPILLFLFGAAFLLWIVVCFNIANLQLVRLYQRRRELAVRIVAGARPKDLARALLTESLLLAALGGVMGCLLAFWCRELAFGFLGYSGGFGGEFQAVKLMSFATVLSLLSGGFISLLPVLRISTDKANQILKETSGCPGLRFNRLQRALVTLQICISLPLLVGCGVLVQNFVRMQQISPGFNPENLLSVDLSLSDRTLGGSAGKSGFLEEITERVASLPGVSRVGAISDLPFSGSNTSGSFHIENRLSMPGDPALTSDQRVITPGYFQAMQIPVVEGRAFSMQDGHSAPPVAVINAAMARRFWPGEDPVGRYVRVGSPQEVRLYGDSVARKIVGIVGNVHHGGLGAEIRAELYVPFAQCPMDAMSLVVRTVPHQKLLASDIRRIIAISSGEEGLVGRILPMPELISQSAGKPEVQIFLFALFTGVTILLVALSIYALLSFSVSQGARGIGISIALGAQRNHILWLVLGEGLKLSARGAVIGCGFAFALVKVLPRTLGLIEGNSLIGYLIAAPLLVLIVLMAGLIPARRALALQAGALIKQEI